MIYILFCYLFRMLGHDRSEEWRDMQLQSEGVRGSWPIWIQFFEPNSCTGSETSIEQCHDKRWWFHDDTCGHHEDIYLVCKVSHHFDIA